MTIRASILARRDLDTGEDMYFAGRTNGRIVTTLWKHEAAQFQSAAAAYECAATHPELADSESWRVVRR